MKKKRPKRMWVSENFHKMIKLKATEKGIDVLKYTEQIVEEDEKKTKKSSFNFDFKL